MNRFLPVLIAFLFPVFIFSQNNSVELLDELDQTVTDYAVYSHKKELKINKLKELLSYTTADIEKYDVGLKYNPKFPNQQKIKAYKPLLSDLIDSLEVYAKKNLC